MANRRDSVAAVLRGELYWVGGNFNVLATSTEIYPRLLPCTYRQRKRRALLPHMHVSERGL